VGFSVVGFGLVAIVCCFMMQRVREKIKNLSSVFAYVAIMFGLSQVVGCGAWCKVRQAGMVCKG